MRIKNHPTFNSTNFPKLPLESHSTHHAPRFYPTNAYDIHELHDYCRQAGDRFRSGRDPSRRTNYLITCRCLPMHRSAERRFGAGVALGFASCRMAFGAPRFMAGEQVRKEQGLSNKLDPVGRAFQPAGAGDFPAPSWFDGLKARRTSSLERLPYSTEIHGMPWAGLLTPLPQAPPTDA